MEDFVKESDAPLKHSSEEDLRMLRDAISLLEKRERRFGRVGYLEKRYHQHARREIQEKMRVSLFAYKESLQLDGIQRYRLKDILSATNNFSEENLIKEGVSEKLYKGQLLRDGNLMNLTVRRLDCTYGQGGELQTEIQTLKSLKHENIISIFGHCDENNEKIIVYEQAFHGTLDRHLSDPTFTWSQRLQVCLGVANAVKCIHYDIIHCDVNSSKIFLNEDWVPKLYGFELSTKYPQSWRHRILYSRYFDTNNMTPKYDEEPVDRNLRKQLDMESLRQYKDLAWKCLNQQPVNRPTMDQIVKELKEVLKLHFIHANIHAKAVDEGTTSKSLEMDLYNIPLSIIKLATNNFDKGCAVGSGGYGTVYKAELDVSSVKSLSSKERECNDGMPKISVAIKRILSREDGQAEKGFLSEIDLLTSCKHLNIISLLGFSRESNEMILVYEYASNGSLSDYIGNKGKSNNLTWTQRIQICLDIAHGINYLHTPMEGKPRIIHRDIKSDNILLDENMTAKLADFGLSKFHNMKQFASTVCTKMLAGTEVYMDPEFMTTGKYKRKSDIYSFGVVLFEVLSGSLAYDRVYLDENDMGLAPVVRQHYKEGTLKELMDPKIIEEDDDRIFTLNRGPNQDSFDAFSKIAFKCLAETQADRPTMEEVIMELKNALNLQGESMVLSRFRLGDINLATKDFAETCCIGLDPNSMVYKAELDHFENNSMLAAEGKDSDVRSKKHITVAIKRIKEKAEFVAELEMAGYKHPNVVSLIGFCDEVDEMILVYDYAPERSLDDYLKSVDNKDNFSWTHRLRMCLEIARGINHLHTMMFNQQRIIHRHIKSANILLGKNLEAKIAYFGISTDIGVNVYKDPEYETTGNMKRNSDIYSLGVVCFEIFCGRLAYDLDFMVENDKGLAPIARQCFNDGTIENIMDPKLTEETHEEISSSNGGPNKDSLKTFLKVAYQCLGEAAKRPTMKTVIKELEIALNLSSYEGSLSHSGSLDLSQHPTFTHSPSFVDPQSNQQYQMVPFTSSPSKKALKVLLLHGNLEIWIHEAKNLPNMDMFHKTMEEVLNYLPGNKSKITSDPYVSVAVTTAVIARTYVISNSENPVWKQHFNVPVAHNAAEVNFLVKGSDVIGSQLIGAVTIPVKQLYLGTRIEGLFPILGANGKPCKVGAVLGLTIQYFPIEKLSLYHNGIGAGPQYVGVPGTYFPLRRGGRVTLYQDAHVHDGSLPDIRLDQDRHYVHGSCWNDIYDAISNARRLIYITGWSVWHKVKLVRGTAQSESSLGDLLKMKSQEGVRVLLLVWDDPTSTNILGYKKNGQMATHDEETRRFFKHSSVQIILVPRIAGKRHSWMKQQEANIYTHHQKTVIVDTDAGYGKRRIVAFVGGLDLSVGRYDSPEHPLFRTSKTVHVDDFHNPTFTGNLAGCPREPWHDMHSKIDGPAAYDVLTNFEERWLKASKPRGIKKLRSTYDDSLLRLERLQDLLGINDQPYHDERDPEGWHVQIFRSIDSNSVKGFPKDPKEATSKNLVCGRNVLIDMSIHTAYVNAIRSAQHFIYIESQYFIGSSFNWNSFKTLGVNNLIPMEIALKIASKIRARERFAVYIIIPMWPEGVPTGFATQRILYWQNKTMQMMYETIHKALVEVGLDGVSSPQDYLNFFCLGNREAMGPHDNVGGESPGSGNTPQGLAWKSRRFMIYVHSKGMIVDDEYVIIGSANINQQSMEGTRAEIAMGAYQPHHTWATRLSNPRGQIYGYRMSLWAEHLGLVDDRFTQPESLECVRYVRSLSEANWTQFAADEVSEMRGHLLKYPVEVGPSGKVSSLPGCVNFPDVGGQIVGSFTVVQENLTI
ncbi:putative phospholipase D, protein kinase RLK-Pelle-LRR-I-1 family [Helianthus annuus]|uniref:Phospholipase D alpha 1 n=1 Tax=Helianthus annuus TaxID=4232 RepID=A0A9K3EPS8_HELAN|nr:putative phospholipase D, protein kinase RLK-Pelle-LRR-I-1 family [Helianthus annuus]